MSIARSYTSEKSQNVYDDVASLTSSKIYSLQGVFSNEEMRIAWNGLGLYISKNMRMGRGVTIPKFGVFTFTPPEVRLKGVTNPGQRDLRPRNPVFIISKDFIKGSNLKSGIFFHQEFGSGLRAYSIYGSNGEVPVTKANFIEISSYANMTKDSVETAIGRVIKFLSQKVRTSGNCSMEIPSIGTFLVRNGIAAVKFNEFIQRDTRNVLSQSIEERKTRGNFSLTKDNLKKFAIFNETHQYLSGKPLDFLKIDDKAKTFLKSDLGLFFDDSNPMRRTLTGFDRSLNTKNLRNNSAIMMASQTSKFNDSIMRNTFNSSAKQFQTTLKYDYNMALKLLKQWILKKKINSQEAFLEFMYLGKGKKDEKGVLTESDLWNACKEISLDITEQQSHELFNLLDFNQDGVVSSEDWFMIIKFDSNALLRKVKEEVNRKGWGRKGIVERGELEGLKSIDLFKLQKVLGELFDFLKEEETYNLAKYLCRNKKYISVEDFLEELGVVDERISKIQTTSDWNNKFMERIKRTLSENNIFEEELISKFEIYDNRHTGVITQTQFKDTLTSLGVHLNVSEIIKAIKQFSNNTSSNSYNINYIDFVQNLKLLPSPQSSSSPTSLTFSQFLSQLAPCLASLDLGLKLPAPIPILASYLQHKYFPSHHDSTISSHLTSLDIDHNNQISKQDLIAFNNSQKQFDRPSLTKSDIHHLIKQLKQKLILKRLSLHELFKMLDLNKNGFITLTEWERLDKVFPLNPGVRKVLFEYIDTEGLKMIDYKGFLEALEINKNKVAGEKFDWVEECLERVRAWWKKSGLMPADAFKVVDRDFDSYINGTDLTTFLVQNLKYQPKEINHNRIQKLLKLMDTFKKGRVDLVDFCKLIQENQPTNSNSLPSTSNWIENAKQQIGLSISRKFKSLPEAFNEIGRTEKNLLFSNFQKWVNSNNILHGFMVNETMLKEVFAGLDSHKKGYLNYNDFVQSFSNFDWKSSLVTEFLETLGIKFKTIQQAFKHISGYSPSNTLTKDQFSKALAEIFPNRFKLDDENELWRQLANNNASLSFSRFNEMFGKQWRDRERGDILEHDFPRDKWKYQDYDIIKGTVPRSLQHSYNQTQDLETQCRKMVEIVKGILRTSSKTMEQVFKQFDKNNTGTITNLEFRHAFRNLNIALTTKEIDLLLNFCDQDKNTINWREFIKKFQVLGDNKQIINRIKTKMQKLNDNIYYYMISPKDAFRKYNNPTTGYMSFEEFYNLYKDIYVLCNESLPQFSIIKEIFDFVDVRGDGKVDYQEWVQTFKNYPPPHLIQGTRPIPPTTTTTPSTPNPPLSSSISHFTQSPQFQQLTQLLSRNRKYLLDKFQSAEKEGTMVDYKVGVDILKELVSTKLSLGEEIYRNYLAFAMKGDRLDYGMLLESIKKRAEAIVDFPKKQVF